jgi:hypothetical protein
MLGKRAVRAEQTKTADVARAVAASELVPKIQPLDEKAVLVSDGFSCNERKVERVSLKTGLPGKTKCCNC